MEGRLWREYNYVLAACVAVLLIFGTLIVHSATLNGGPLRVLFPRHLINIAVGAGAMVCFTLLDYRQLAALARPLYIGTVAILAIVLVAGRISSGAQSWIAIGTRTFQPSEPAKLAIIIVLAAYWSRYEDKRDDLRVHLGSLLLIGVPLLLIFVQPDLGTAVVFGAIWLSMAWTAGLRWYYMLALIMLMIPICYLGWRFVLDPYQKIRLSTFYWLLTDPAQVRGSDDAYNIVQAMSAISSGGWFGTGLSKGLLSQGSYIPVQYSDFIFAVVGEELGFVGGVVLLIFEGLMLWVSLAIADRSRDRFGQLLVAGIFGMALSHILINVGMNVSIMPVTGLPLPFISYGGSFTIMMLAAVGLMQSVAMRWRKISF